jgi:hypothetical protein
VNAVRVYWVNWAMAAEEDNLTIVRAANRRNATRLLHTTGRDVDEGEPILPRVEGRSLGWVFGSEGCLNPS